MKNTLSSLALSFVVVAGASSCGNDDDNKDRDRDEPAAEESNDSKDQDSKDNQASNDDTTANKDQSPAGKRAADTGCNLDAIAPAEDDALANEIKPKLAGLWQRLSPQSHLIKIPGSNNLGVLGYQFNFDGNEFGKVYLQVVNKNGQAGGEKAYVLGDSKAPYSEARFGKQIEEGPLAGARLVGLAKGQGDQRKCFATAYSLEESPSKEPILSVYPVVEIGNSDAKNIAKNLGATGGAKPFTRSEQ